jgi:hypothetical protein
MHDPGMIGDLANAERRRRLRHQEGLCRHEQLVSRSGSLGAAQT